MKVSLRVKRALEAHLASFQVGLFFFVACNFQYDSREIQSLRGRGIDSRFSDRPADHELVRSWARAAVDRK